jgi:hypothetical protein
MLASNEIEVSMKLKSWSHTRLGVFEGCKYRAELAYIQKIPEPERPLPAGKTEHANDRGTRLHEAAEMFVKGGVELLPELKKFEAEYTRARELFAEGRASMEGDWGFTKDWEPVAWMSEDVWCRIKCDLVCHVSDTEIVVIDYKSGKRYGNELKHAEQMQLYVIGTLFRYPKTKRVTTELWYLDQDELASMTYTREQGLRFVKNFERRANLLTACEEFTPNPSAWTCKWCPYKPKEKGGTGHCSVGV